MNALVLARRELRSAFGTPVGWALLAAVPAVLSAFFFVLGPFFAEGAASLRRFFELLPGVLILAAPAATMRLWAEERRSGTEELLSSYPFRVAELVLGKFLAAWALLALALLFTGAVPFSVAALGDLDWGPVAGGYVAALLLAAACAAVGLCASACTRNQVVAWLLAAAILLLFNVIRAAGTATGIPAWLARLFLSLDFGLRFAALARGVVDSRDLAFFAAVTAWFLALNGLLVELRRWRQGL